MAEDDKRLEAVAKAIEQSWLNIIKEWKKGVGDGYTLDNLDHLDALDMAQAAIEAVDHWDSFGMMDEAYERGWRDAMSQDNPPMSKEQDNG